MKVRYLNIFIFSNIFCFSLKINAWTAHVTNSRVNLNYFNKLHLARQKGKLLFTLINGLFQTLLRILCRRLTNIYVITTEKLIELDRQHIFLSVVFTRRLHFSFKIGNIFVFLKPSKFTSRLYKRTNFFNTYKKYHL